MMATMQLIPVGRLQFGQEAVPPINVRTAGRDLDIDALAASIKAHGLIQHLAVQTSPAGIFVADGNRRLAALRALLGRGEITEGFEVPCQEVDENADPAEISLAANVMRRGLHPADEYVAFVDLADQGQSETDIAQRFGIEPRRVRRILALGRLSPMIIDA